MSQRVSNLSVRIAIFVAAGCAAAVVCVDAGSVQPASRDKADHWAFKPITHPTPPSVADATWVRTPIDNFILAKLAEKGLKPSPPADKRSLLRRVYFDLTGLPPAPQEMADFLADHSADAYEKVVDRLLASPRYGERWARHWMDVIHFAETHGNDQDRERPNAWPYRDYLVHSFNDDKPYARFIREQIAGDVLYPDDPQAIVALGFAAAGPWDESSQMCIRDDVIDKKVAQNLDRDDMVQTTMATFTSTTVGCARCHNHKFDPISQADYYGLQSVFAGVERADRPYDIDPHRRMLARQKHALEAGGYLPGASPIDPEVLRQVARWEATVKTHKSHWVVLDPDSYSGKETTLNKLPDQSVVASGPRPVSDTYTIWCSTNLTGITAARIEMMTDDRLPHKGPGRADNGNFALSELYLKASPKKDFLNFTNLEFGRAHADFDQTGWTIAMAIDHNLKTAWSIYPQVGKPHVGVFELKKPVGFEGGTVLMFVLQQTHGDGHLIGRFRLSLTTDPLPAHADDPSFPPAIAAIFATPPAQRTEAARTDLARYYLLQKIDAELSSLPPLPQVYALAGDFASRGKFSAPKVPRPVFVLHRGDILQPEAPAVPGALSCVPGLPARFELSDPNDEAARRAALAKWLSDPRNCLTWRSIVNRVWHYHFGKGIAATPNDFGHMGTPPTHPELLDWLASWFLEHGGSLKQLHKLIVTSSVYRQSCTYNAEYAKLDAGNQFLWRAERTRLDAESVRDTILQVSGLLDTTMGGPSAKQFIQSKGTQVTPLLDYSGFDPDNPAERRLSIYRFIYRTLPDPFMEAMDCPDASQFAPARNTSVTALQALAMLNDRFVVRYSAHLAERVAHGHNDIPGQISAMYELCLNRAPTAEESEAMSTYARKYGMANACRIMLNSNEFLFVN